MRLFAGEGVAESASRRRPVANTGQKTVACTCPSGETCLDGVCRTLAGACQAGPTSCSSGKHIVCNGLNYCWCDVAMDGALGCRGFVACGVCTSNDDRGPGRVCLACPGRAGVDTGCATPC